MYRKTVSMKNSKTNYEIVFPLFNFLTCKTKISFVPGFMSLLLPHEKRQKNARWNNYSLITSHPLAGQLDLNACLQSRWRKIRNLEPWRVLLDEEDDKVVMRVSQFVNVCNTNKMLTSVIQTKCVMILFAAVCLRDHDLCFVLLFPLMVNTLCFQTHHSANNNKFE